ncbi:MAG: hypothetical protein ACRETG_12520, partial [Steroidobacteraceae bacterium]
PDVLAYDSALGYLYVAAESGVVSIFRIRGKQVEKVADTNLGPNAHVVAADPETHDSYYPLKDVGGRTVLRIMRPR